MLRLCVPLLWMVVVAGQTPPQRAVALRESALIERVSSLPTDQRIKASEKLIASNPENLQNQNLLASAFLLKMRETTDPSYLDRATKLVDKVLVRDARNYGALRLRTEIELANHNFGKAAAASRELARTAPEDPANWGTLGDALMETGDYDGAADAYQKMAALRPDLPSYNRAAWYRYVTGDPQGAIEFMKMAVNAGSRSAEHVAWCSVELGNLYLRINSQPEAGEAFASALKLLPNYHPAWAGTGKVLAARGDYAPAIQAFRKAQSIVPLPDYAAALHDLYSLTRKKSEAEKQLASVDLIDKMDEAAQQKGNRALVYIYANKDYRLDRALQLARTELTIRQDVFTWDALAWALYKNDQYEEAEKASRKALALSTPDAGFYYHAGMIAAARGKKSEARQNLEKALELNPVFDLRQPEIARRKLSEL